MLYVKTCVASSAIAGNGLFANEFIPKGTLIWKLDLLESSIDEVEFQALTEDQKKYVKNFCYKTDGRYVMCVDDARYMNHSATPNTINNPDEPTTIASVNINIGDEITTDYGEFDEDIDFKLK